VPTVLVAGEAASAQAKTVANERQTNLGADQTRVLASEAQTLLANDATNVRPVIAREAETIVRPVATAERSRVWLAAAALVVLVAGSVGAFYVYRTRRNTVRPGGVSAPTEVAQPAQTNQATSATADGLESAAEKESANTSERKNDKPRTEAPTQRSITSK